MSGNSLHDGQGVENSKLALIDGRDALAFLIVRPHPDDPARVAIECDARIDRRDFAEILRRCATQLDHR